MIKLKLVLSMLLLFAINVAAQESERIWILGVVLNEDNKPLPGVVVQEKETSNGSITDTDGRYSIYLRSENAILDFSMLGYQPQSIVVGGKKEINVTMTPEVAYVNEIVVVGFGRQKKESVVGAISTLSPSTISNTSKTSLSQSLAGNVAGIIAVQRSGELGNDHADFWIRGINTFKGGSNPLVVVDGVERDFNSLDPQEIESFSVLKDASATAIYGVRGANGVIMVTTKKGKVGAPKVSVTTEYALKQPTILPKFVDAVDYMKIANQANVLTGNPETFNAARINNTINNVDPDIYPNVNWVNELLRPLTMHERVNVNVSGGSPRVRYFMSASFHHEDGLYKTDTDRDWDANIKMNKVNFRANLDVDLTSSTLVNLNIGSQHSTRNTPNISTDYFWGLIVETPPNFIPKRYSDGKLAAFGAGSEKGKNPYNYLTQYGNSRATQNDMKATGSILQKLDFITQGLSAKVTYAYDVWTGNYYTGAFSPELWYATSRNAADNTLNAIQVEQGSPFLQKSITSSMSYSTYLEGSINYGRRFGDHNVSALLLYNQRIFNVTSASDEYGAIPYRNQGIAGRATYSYHDRYFFEFNFGYNGSENFAKGHRYGFFPSIALGWMISEERFWKPIERIFTTFKLRGSIGNVGNDKLANNLRFAYITKITDDGGYNFGFPGSDNQYSGLMEGDMGNKNLTWETETKRNIGLEMVLFNSLEIDFDYFNNDRTGILITRETIPGTVGLNVAPNVNYGKMNNHGFDASVRYSLVKGDWRISAVGTFTFARNKMIEKDEPVRRYANLIETGHPFNQQFGLIAERLYTDDDFDMNGNLLRQYAAPQFGVKVMPGDIKYADVNGDGKIDINDRTAIGYNESPEIVYGFGANVTWKGLDFGIRFQGVAHTTRFINNDNFIPFARTMQRGNLYSDVIFNRWTPENPSQDVFFPRMRDYKDGHNYVESTWWQKDMSFLRLKDISLGYTIPSDKTRKAGIEKLRVYLLANNLVTFSEFKLWDVELGTSDGMKYPMMRNFILGLELSF
jgi:TonB-linked SusC/RagA family outer membrane protein